MEPSRNMNNTSIREIFSFIKDRIKENIINSISMTSLEKSLISNGDIYKVFSDLPYVRENLNLKNFEITLNIEEADIIWLNFDYFTFLICNSS